MTIEQWAAEMWRRAKDTRAARCDGCPSKVTCFVDGALRLCKNMVAALTEAGVVPVVKAPERREA